MLLLQPSVVLSSYGTKGKLLPITHKPLPHSLAVFSMVLTPNPQHCLEISAVLVYS